MRSDVVNLRQFYSSPLGRKVRQSLRQRVHEAWGQSEATSIVGFGYTTPVLRMLERSGGTPRNVIAIMPARQGAIYWPVHSNNRSVLADELRPPIASQTVQHILLLHALEHVARPDDWLQTLWHLLVPGGRMLVIVPNRRGLWAIMGSTPFSSGTPYTQTQLRMLLEAAGFTLRETRTVVFRPPSAHPFWLRIGGGLEWCARLCFPRMGGVLVVEVEKQIYAGLMSPVVDAKRTRQWVPA